MGGVETPSVEQRRLRAFEAVEGLGNMARFFASRLH